MALVVKKEGNAFFCKDTEVPGIVGRGHTMLSAKRDLISSIKFARRMKAKIATKRITGESPRRSTKINRLPSASNLKELGEMFAKQLLNNYPMK